MAHTAAVGEEVGGGACAVAKVAGEGMSGNRALYGCLNRFSHRAYDPCFQSVHISISNKPDRVSEPCARQNTDLYHLHAQSLTVHSH